MKACKNCDQPLADADKYCSDCGAPFIAERITVRRVGSEISERYLGTDNRFLTTYIDMFRRPEVVIGSFLQGVRKRYVNAFSYFVISLTLSGIMIYLIEQFQVDVTGGLLENASEGERRTTMWLTELTSKYQTLFASLFLPVFAFIGWLTFYTLRRYNYAEHFVAFTYVYSHYSITIGALSIITILLGLDYTMLAFGSQLLFVGFGFYTYFRWMRLKPLSFIWRTLLFLLLVGMLYLVSVIVGFALYAIFDPDGFAQFLKEAASRNK